jgi:RNA polymerase sigma-70 factor, ECF subfamily
MDREEQRVRFLELLRPIEGDLEKYSRRMVFDRRDFEDALQNAVLRAFRAFDRYHDGASFRAWMFKILTNEIFTINRKRGRIAEFEIAIEPEEIEEFAGLDFTTDAPISWETLADALDEELLAALQSLNDSERAVLLMRAIGDLRYREISECLGIPLGSVMGNFSRARQKMRDAILRARRRSCL